MEQDFEEPDRPPWEQVVWWLSGVLAGGFFGSLAGAVSGSSALVVPVWILWLPCMWVLWRIGFWRRFERFVLWLWRPIGALAWAVGRLLAPCVTIFAAVTVGLGRLLLIALFMGIVALIVLGITGLLWLGLSQFF